jgi:hypothetical protein
MSGGGKASFQLERYLTDELSIQIIILWEMEQSHPVSRQQFYTKNGSNAKGANCPQPKWD